MSWFRKLYVYNNSNFVGCSGMPYPQNLETAKEVEAIVRENGAEPATIAILDGVPCVGIIISFFLIDFPLRASSP